MIMIYRAIGKRLVDIILSGVGLIFFSPIFIVLGLAIRIRLGRPIFFKQVRPGLYGKPFTMIKFRTMNNISDRSGLLPDEKRIEPFGLWLRSTSLDELPELINVFSGKMSLVGPRPLLLEYLPLYTKEQKRRHEVKPGITGLAQVEGRNSLSWQKRFELDVKYIESFTFWIDLKILLITLIKVIKREDIASKGFITSAPFSGDVEDEA